MADLSHSSRFLSDGTVDAPRDETHHLGGTPYDFHYRGQVPVAPDCLKKAIAKIKFVLHLFGRRCKLSAQVQSFKQDWLVHGFLGHFEGEKLVLSF